MERLLQCYAQSTYGQTDSLLGLNRIDIQRMRLFVNSISLPFRSVTTLAGCPLPASPKWVRRLRGRIAASHYSQAVFWNCLPDRYSRSVARDRQTIYYDHSLAWYRPPRYDEADDIFDMAIACSQASARMLRLNWEYTGPVHICPNPTINAQSSPATPKDYPVSRRFRIGMAGRLTAGKGFTLGVFALASLLASQYDCELHVAGTGDDATSLEALAERLGISDHVCFHGQVNDMDRFYDRIDCLLHPTLHEASGLTLREAVAAGCPVISTRVDGISEWFENSASAQLIRPDVPIDRFIRDLGGADDDLPPHGYDPVADRLCNLAAADPEQIANCLRHWIDHPEMFEQASKSALQLAAQKQITPASYLAALASLLD